MALRDFIDRTGRAWQVWSTIPKPSPSGFSSTETGTPRAAGPGPTRAAAPIPAFATGREHGWLTFASSEEKRRLSPIPGGWEEAPDDVLADYCERADRIAPPR